VNNPPHPTITILCSGVALGVYIPALLINEQLKRRGVASEVVVLETLFRDEKQKRVLENKVAFHQSFEVAKMGQRIVRDMTPNLDTEKLGRLYASWTQEARRLFIVFSGFWIPILNVYRQRIAPAQCWVHHIHMDAAASASWKNAPAASEGDQVIWIFNEETMQLDFRLMNYAEPPICYDLRPERYLIHGGGWGMGTYQSQIPVLEAAGLHLDIIAYSPEEAAAPRPRQRYFMVDPRWSPWHKNSAGEHEFPPFGEVKPGTTPRFTNRPDSHEFFQLVRTARAVIGKPGGASLLDSWTAATPVVMLEPFGDHEAKNAALWQALGFGIPFSAWQAAGFAMQLLVPLHQNLLRSQEIVPDYVDRWLPNFRVYL
jgi:hypothetical protein